MSSASAPMAIMRLTPRDRILIQVLQELRYLTAAQIRQVCYPSIAVRSTSHRLSLLRGHGLLTCLTHRSFEDRRAFWGLTTLGRAVAVALTESSPDRPRVSAVAALQMEHLIATNQVFCDLCTEHRQGRLGSFRWYGSHHARVDLGSTHLVPDAVILAAAPEGNLWMYCLEVDRHTMAREALAEKFERYRLMFRIAALRREDPLWEARAESWMLFACQNAPRASEAARVASDHGLERVWAGPAVALPRSLAVVIGAASGSPQSVLPGGVGGILPPVEPGGLAPVQREEPS